TRSAKGQFGDSQTPSNTRRKNRLQKPLASAAAAPDNDQEATANAYATVTVSRSRNVPSRICAMPYDNKKAENNWPRSLSSRFISVAISVDATDIVCLSR